MNKKIAKDIVLYLYNQAGNFSNQYQLINTLTDLGYSTNDIYQTIVNMKKINCWMIGLKNLIIQLCLLPFIIA
jgi:hypothetical protein